MLRLFLTSSILTMICYFWLVLPPSTTKTPLPAIISFASGHGFSPRKFKGLLRFIHSNTAIVLLVVLVPEIVASKYVSTTLGAHKAVSTVLIHCSRSNLLTCVYLSWSRPDRRFSRPWPESRLTSRLRKRQLQRLLAPRTVIPATSNTFLTPSSSSTSYNLEPSLPSDAWTVNKSVQLLGACPLCCQISKRKRMILPVLRWILPKSLWKTSGTKCTDRHRWVPSPQQEPYEACEGLRCLRPLSLLNRAFLCSDRLRCRPRHGTAGTSASALTQRPLPRLYEPSARSSEERYLLCSLDC